MNKLSKRAIEQFNGLDIKSQTYAIAKALNTLNYKDFHAKYSGKCPSMKLPYIFLSRFLKNSYETTTIFGVRRANQTHFPPDKLSVKEVWFPNGKFAPSADGTFAPLGSMVQCTELILPFAKAAHEQRMTVEWNKIKHSLASKSLDTIGGYSFARLDYEPIYNDSQDVYFALDKSNEIVKIGISKNIAQRIESIKKEYNTGELTVIAIIKAGGLAIEKQLHKRFSHIRHIQKGKGNEWFQYNDEIALFVKKLNHHPIKSQLLSKHLDI